jgi:hypothetical protein
MVICYHNMVKNKSGDSMVSLLAGSMEGNWLEISRHMSDRTSGVM